MELISEILQIARRYLEKVTRTNDQGVPYSNHSELSNHTWKDDFCNNNSDLQKATDIGKGLEQ